MANRVIIIGIGYKPLDGHARSALAAADFILGSRRLCEVFERYPEYGEWGHKIRRIDSVDGTMDFIREALSASEADIVLLGSGDPLFYGIGARAVREFGRERVEIIPDMTSLQVAFSRIREPWDEAVCVSFHGGPNPEKRRRLKYGIKDLPSLLLDNDLIGILTDKENDPSAIARFLVTSFGDHSPLRIYVGERMGYPDERITEGTANEIAAMSFVHPNVVIVKKMAELPGDPLIDDHASYIKGLPRFGLREDEISHSHGLITKDEIRAVTIHSLRFPTKGVFWDIGSGSGSVAVEAARLCPALNVYAIEKSPEQIVHLERNKAGFGPTNLMIVAGEAPIVLTKLPTPQRVFVGGSGGNLVSIVDVVDRVMTKGIVVINAATIETLDQAMKALEKAGFAVKVSQVSVARSKPVGSGNHLSGLNPIFVVSGERE